MTSPEEDDFFNPSLLKAGGAGSFDEFDDRLANKLSISEYDDDKNDETFGNDIDVVDDGFFASSHHQDLLLGNNHHHQQHPKSIHMDNTTTAINNPLNSGSQTWKQKGVSANNNNTAANTVINTTPSNQTSSGRMGFFSTSTPSPTSIPFGHSPSSPSNYIPGGGSSGLSFVGSSSASSAHHHPVSSVGHAGAFTNMGTSVSHHSAFSTGTSPGLHSTPGLFGTTTTSSHPPSASPTSTTSPGILSSIFGGAAGSSSGSIHNIQHHTRQGSSGSTGGIIAPQQSPRNQQVVGEDAFLGPFFGGTGSGSAGVSVHHHHHHHTSSASSIGSSSGKQANSGLHFINDLISEEDEDMESISSSNRSNPHISSGNNSPFGIPLGDNLPNSRIPLTGGLESLEFLPLTICHKHPELVKPQPQQQQNTSTTTSTGSSTATTLVDNKTTSNNASTQQHTTPSYLLVKYNTYNTENKEDCYNVINKTVINEVLNKIPTPQEHKYRYNRYNSNSNRSTDKPHRIIQFMRIDEVESIVRQQMVDLQVNNGYEDDYYYFIHNNKTEENTDLVLKHLLEEEESRENSKNVQTNASNTTPVARLFGRIPSQNVRTPRTCFDTNVFRQELIEQYFKHKRMPSELRTRLIYNNSIQLRTSIENGLTLLIEIEEFLTIAKQAGGKEIPQKLSESFRQNCQTIAAYLQYQQEIWNIPKGKKFIYKALKHLPEPFITKLMIDMIPILNLEYHTNPTLLEAMNLACKSIINIDAIPMILMSLMSSPIIAIEFISTLLNRAITILSNGTQQAMMSVHSWYQFFVQSFVPYFLNCYSHLTQSSPDATYNLLSLILKLIPKNSPQFMFLVRTLAADLNSQHPLRTQLLQQYAQPLFHNQ
ncbi:hypothetical protein C9374_000413 [Naegleria lovaniensis]|uniref:mRNA decay factor PAT1 domain-containing protein n=1 Tax=Naegleria lovaniensis TaxID=51637 RepID=A0AA88GYY1_NAELO|nr:uncharacterized protein C9374_013206 [Naegleria lovaniensis]XP_044552241.1 uncharacterized protein C9374_000413 [Naegleria lovaniensis]KAG2372754.1 hypothetical protein C9374_013206 [Naegleria lovaniensis]KAG2388249.1 hypothetical protein C9374_000413 [Naegleria lovaniensis]